MPPAPRAGSIRASPRLRPPVSLNAVRPAPNADLVERRERGPPPGRLLGDARALHERYARALSEVFPPRSAPAIDPRPAFVALLTLERALPRADASALRDQVLARGALGACLAAASAFDVDEGLTLGFALELLPAAAELSVTRGRLPLAPVLARPLSARVRRAERAVGGDLVAWSARSLVLRRLPAPVLASLASTDDPALAAMVQLLARAGEPGAELPGMARIFLGRMSRALEERALPVTLERFLPRQGLHRASEGRRLARAASAATSGIASPRASVTVLAFDAVLESCPEGLPTQLLRQSALETLEARLEEVLQGLSFRVERTELLYVFLSNVCAEELAPLLPRLALGESRPVLLAGCLLSWRVHAAGATAEPAQGRFLPDEVAAVAAAAALRVEPGAGLRWASRAKLIQAEARLEARRGPRSGVGTVDR
jgi:hypothetical protein